MIRKWIAGPLLALLAALCLPPAPALAAEQPPDAAETVVSVWSPKEAGADSQELFAAYVMQQFYGSYSEHIYHNFTSISLSTHHSFVELIFLSH